MRSTQVFLFAAAAVTGCAFPAPLPPPAPARPAAVESAPTSGLYGGMEARIVSLVNAERKERGLRPLVWNDRLDQAAKLHARNMATYRRMSHVIPEAKLPTLSARAQHVQYPYAMIAENIALGYMDAESVVRGWMGSPGHRRNILSAEATEIGTGVVSSKTGGFYFCQVFGRRLTSI
jgi:uncharacterized protein YkwD